MLSKVRDWFGFGGFDQPLSAGHGHSHGSEGGHGHTHGVIDPSIASSERGVWAIKWSFVILAITAAIQFAVVLLSGSVALLADMIHNVGDATTAIPLWLAFVLARRKPSKTFTYGLGRAEDLAGILIVLIILFSAVVAGYQAITRLLHPEPVQQLGWLAVAGVIGFIGNEVVRSILNCDTPIFSGVWQSGADMAASGFDHLGLDERRSLFRLREARVSVAEIASRLGRHRSTIYRELARNRYRDRENAGDRRCDISGYYPVTAQDQALARRRRLAKLARHKDLLAHVVDRLRAGWSPQQIAGRLRLDGASGADGKAVGRLCHETIYRHVYGSEGRTEQLYLCLPRARRRRATRHGRKPRGRRIPPERGIACRPAEAATRDSFGHWEGDLLIFARNGGPANVTTLLERRSRFLVLLANPDRRPIGVAGRIGAALGGSDAGLRRTVTFDRGLEFMGYPALDRSLGCTSYFCDPRSPWQKGAVENANGRLRRHLPSNVAAERLSAGSLDALAARLNATPRRCLGYRTPAEVFNGRLGTAPAEAGPIAAVSH